MPSAQTQNPRPWISNLMIVVFFGLLWLPALDGIFHFDPSPAPNEKRAPASFPSFHFAPTKLRDYLQGLENYFNDHFGFRKSLLRLEHKLKRGLFHESGVTEAMIGQNGWLFLARGGMVDDMLGNISFSTAQLSDWQRVFETRHNWCRQRGITYLLVIVPEKHSVYPEFLPTWIPTDKTADPIGKLVACLNTNTTVPVVYLRAALIAAKETDLTYQATDSHWNDYGAFVAYQQILNALAQQRPGLASLPQSDFELRRSQQPGGDLAVMLGQEQTLVESNHIELVPRPPRVRLTAQADASLSVRQRKKETDPAILKTVNPAATGKVILFRDSFAVALMPFLAQNFHEAIYVWQHDWDAKFLEQQRPDIVIDEIAARSFYRGDRKSWENE